MKIEELCQRVYFGVRAAVVAAEQRTGKVSVVVSPVDYRALLKEFSDWAEQPEGEGRGMTTGNFAVRVHSPSVFGVPLVSDYVLSPGQIVLRTEVAA